MNTYAVSDMHVKRPGMPQAAPERARMLGPAVRGESSPLIGPPREVALLGAGESCGLGARL